MAKTKKNKRKISTATANKRNADAKKKEILLDSLSKGTNVTDACNAAKIGRTTFYVWLDRDKKFNFAVTQTKDGAILVMENALFESGKNGDVQAQKFFLCNKAPEKWKNQNNIQVGGVPSAAEVADLIAAGLGFERPNNDSGAE